MAAELKITVGGKPPGDGDGAGQLGTRVPAQDFTKIRRECLRDNKLFEDPYFPANDKSLFYTQTLPFKPVWKRPKEISSNPVLFSEGASRFDIQQGMLGDCWLVAAIASLTQDTKQLRKVIPDDQGFDSKYTGVFHFRFWHFGEWVDIVVDDRLPTHNGKLIFIHSTDVNEFWGALLEKAYAKLYGSFEALKGGKTSEAMTDFTGGVVESFDLQKEKDNEELYGRILRSAKRSALMSCSIKAARNEVEKKLDTGLVMGHAYSVTGAEEVTVKGKKVKLIRIRNPWGQKEWKGDWGDDSDTWKSVSAAERQKLTEGQGAKEDGEFYMSFDDFKKHFTDFEMCSVSIDEMQEDSSKISFNSIIINGSWDTSKNTAGGCRNFPTFVNNPQYVIELNEDADGDGKCSVVIALMQKNRRAQKNMGVQDLCIGYTLYKAPPDGSNTITKQYVDYNYSTANSGSFSNAREVMKRFDLDPGKYFILPCAFKPNEEGDFLLRVFTESFSSETTAAPADKDKGAAPENPRVSQIKKMFHNLAGADGEIDSEELQDVLTASLSKDMIGDVFSIDACRSMISMLDEDKNGTLSFEEFQNLLQTIAEWKRMFYKFDRDRSGTLERQEVYSAIRSIGYDSISPDNFNVLFNRFARKRKYMKLDDFASCLVRVKIMNDTYKRASQGERITLTRDEFFKLTLDA